MNICLIAEFDHNTGKTACGLELDTWTIKYPDLTGALQYGYAKGSGSEVEQVNCVNCLASNDYKDDLANWNKFINTPEQEIIDLNDRLKIRWPQLANKFEEIKQSTLQYIRKHKR